MPIENRLSRARQLAVTGVDWGRTRRALALAVALGGVAAILRILAPATPGIGFAFGMLHAVTLEAAPAALLADGIGVFTVLGLAALHAYLNEGYLPSLVLAAAPSYGAYVFNGPGAAPVWAASYVLPYVLTAGTLGFLLGVGARWRRGKSATAKPDFSLPE